MSIVKKIIKKIQLLEAGSIEALNEKINEFLVQNPDFKLSELRGGPHGDFWGSWIAVLSPTMESSKNPESDDFLEVISFFDKKGVVSQQQKLITKNKQILSVFKNDLIEKLKGGDNE